MVDDPLAAAAFIGFPFRERGEASVFFLILGLLTPGFLFLNCPNRPFSSHGFLHCPRLRPPKPGSPNHTLSSNTLLPFSVRTVFVTTSA